MNTLKQSIRQEMSQLSTIEKQFEVAGALYMLCSRWHSGQWSLGYKILSILSIQWKYKPGRTVEFCKGFESPLQKNLYRMFFRDLVLRKGAL